MSVFSKPKEEITQKFVSTVIQSSIPETLLRELDRKSQVIKLTFFGENSKESLISDINKRFAVETTILSASVNELQNKILGIMILQLRGTEEEITKTKKYIRDRKIEMERVVLEHA